MTKKTLFNLKNISLLALAFFSGSVFSETFEINITNLTAGQSFTPRLAITHSAGHTFTLGKSASPELAFIAEDGQTTPMQNLLKSDAVFPLVTSVKVNGGLLKAGGSETFTIEGKSNDKFTLLNMLIPTNDAFVGLNGVSLPSAGSVSYRGVAYDAGTESNDERCVNIPGPTCGGTGSSENDVGEGFVHVHPGIHGIADLKAEANDWRNPVIMVKITKK